MDQLQGVTSERQLPKFAASYQGTGKYPTQNPFDQFDQPQGTTYQFVDDPPAGANPFDKFDSPKGVTYQFVDEENSQQGGSGVDMSQLSDSDLEAIARNDMTKVSDAGLAHIAHSGGTLHSNIAKYEQQGYSAEEILKGIKVSGKYKTISAKINRYAADGYTPKEILEGLKQSKWK